MTAWVHVPPEREDEFNDWYDLEHLPQVVALPGFVRGRRYMVENAKPKYLAWYDTADERVEPGAGSSASWPIPRHGGRAWPAVSNTASA